MRSDRYGDGRLLASPRPAQLDGAVEPGRVLDRTGPLDELPDGYRLMNDREVLKLQIAF